jgi:hypothetical protein
MAFIKKFQAGGPMPAEAPVDPAMAGAAPAPEQGGDPIMQIAEMAGAALQSQDCALAMQVCEAFMMLVEQMAGGGAEPVGAPQGEPVFKKGGVIARRNRK